MVLLITIIIIIIIIINYVYNALDYLYEVNQMLNTLFECQHPS